VTVGKKARRIDRWTLVKDVADCRRYLDVLIGAIDDPEAALGHIDQCDLTSVTRVELVNRKRNPLCCGSSSCVAFPHHTILFRTVQCRHAAIVA
jgi:hypothetical protein